jgi:hypothetical protein
MPLPRLGTRHSGRAILLPATRHLLLRNLPRRLRPLPLLIPPVMKRLVRQLFLHPPSLHPSKRLERTLLSAAFNVDLIFSSHSDVIFFEDHPRTLANGLTSCNPSGGQSGGSASQPVTQNLTPLAFIECSHVWQALYLANKLCEQRRDVISSPRESQRQRHVQINHW